MARRSQSKTAIGSEQKDLFVKLKAALAAGLLSSLALFPLHAQAERWDLNDVTMVMPMTLGAESRALLTPISTGDKGQLLSTEAFSKLPDPFVINMKQEEALKRLKVVAMRIDPCFRETENEACRPVLRISWQPHHGDYYVDAAIHSFYQLTEDEFGSLTSKLLELKAANQGDLAGKLPLGVHPIIAKQGLKGPYWKALKATILRFAGETNLFRMTFMTLLGRTNMWTFGGFENKGNGLEPIKIARTDATIQTALIHAQPPFHFDGGIDPEPSKKEINVNEIMKGTMRLALPRLTAKERKMVDSSFESSVIFENPRRFTSENLDCVSCHVAQPVKQWILNFDPATGALAQGKAYENPEFDLTNNSATKRLTNQLRALGYYTKMLVISQRVINESAEVAAAMNQR